MAKADIAVLQAFDACATTDWKMLIAGLPHAIEEKADKRHKFQCMILELMNAALHDSKKHTTTIQAASAAKVQEAEAELEARKMQAKEAVSAEELTAAALDAKVTALAAARDDLKKGEEKLRPANTENAKVAKRLEECKKERDQASFVVEATLNLLRSGELADERDESIDNLRTFLQKIKVEDTLIAAMPGVYRVKPESRRAFDQFADQAIEKAAADHLAKLNEVLEKETREAEEVKVEALGLWAIVDVAKDSVSSAEAEMASATKAHESTQRARTRAEASVVEQERLCKSLGSENQSQLEKLALHEGAFEALERLRKGDYAVSVVAAAETTCDLENASTDVQMADAVLVA